MTADAVAATTHALACVSCGTRQDGAGYHTACSCCGGLLDTVYDLSRAAIGEPSLDPVSRFAGLLPARPAAFPPGHGVVSTPLIQLETGDAVPVTTYAKWEGGQPTGSAKYPMAVVALTYMHERGVRGFTFSSTGNTTAAFASALRMWPGMTGHVFAPAGFPVPTDAPPNLIVYEVPGDYAKAHHVAAAMRFDGAVAEGGFFSVGRREGLKLAYLDALLAAPRPPTVVVQAVSSGMGIVAAAKAAGELAAMGLIERKPRLVAVQQASCAPMAASFQAGAAALRPGDVIQAPQGRAIAILLGDPSASYPYVRAAVASSGGTVTEVPDPDITAALHCLRRHNLDPCCSSATALGALAGLRRSGWITDADVVLVNLTGSARSAAGRQEATR
ncbi:MAG TPA: pyridoxal-phosphate dependent enzyme [Streptosporangiaceae bacterium]|nr:pyridoxal-phosphate dependent enzyme [Streptosporangiaceae bacterium]